MGGISRSTIPITYGDQRLTGWAYLSGMLRFMVQCGIGAISNVGVASWIYAHDNVWWIAARPSAGAVMGRQVVELRGQFSLRSGRPR